MKIIFTPFGSLGDNRPLVALGHALIEAGHTIIACSTPDNKELYESYGIRFYPVGKSFYDFLKEHNSLMGNPLRLIKAIVKKELFTDNRAYAPIVEQEIKDADLVIGSGLQVMAQSVAEAYSVPYIHAQHIPSAIPSKYHPPLMVPWHNLPHWINKALWNMDNIGSSMVFPAVFNSYRKEKGLKIIRSFWPYVTRSILLSSDSEIGPIPPDTSCVTFQTGYWHLKEKRPLGKDIESFLDKGRPPVFVGFGSMIDSNPEKTMKIVTEAIMRTGNRAIISKGWAEYKKYNNDENVFIVDQTPHEQLFPRMATVMHHGGAGTIHSAARAGIPQIIIPHIFDQYYWAKRITDLGLGPSPIPYKKLTVDRVSRALDEVVNNKTIQNSATNICKLLKKRDSIKETVCWLEKMYG